MTFQINVRQVIHTLAEALDLVGVDEVNHGKRVAFMAVECARVMGFEKDRMDTVHHASLLHDCGVSSTRVHKNLVTKMDWEGSQEHCLRGGQLLSRCRLFTPLSPIIHYHHTHWEDLPSDLDPETALISNLIFLSDRIDSLIAKHGDTDILIARNQIRDEIETYRHSFFKAELVDAFLEVANREFFWLSLDSKHLTYHLSEMERMAGDQTIDSRTLLEVATIFADIVDTKSTFTAEHSLGVARLARFLGTLVGSSGETLNMLETAGLLHDLGKLMIPDEILDKPGPLDARERAVMMRHSFESYQILRKINGFEELAKWAAFHHEDLSGKGYPFHEDMNGLSIEARIIAAADVFQALAQDRPYRDSLPPNKIMSIMAGMVEQRKLDGELVDLIGSRVDQCYHHALCAA